MSSSLPTQNLSDAGVSIWLDDLSRHSLDSGHLKQVIEKNNVVGVTTNPTIFAQALSQSDAYAQQATQLCANNATVQEAVFALTSADVTRACDLFQDIYSKTQGYDGRVSIEVEPTLAHDAEKTIEQAKQLVAMVDRANVLIKIPATSAGLNAITEVIANGISVNVTLIFSLERYHTVIDAYLTGLEKAHKTGIDLSTIHSVASFFVSRVDTDIDAKLREIGSAEALSLCGKAAIANAQLAYEMFEEMFATERAERLLAAGANFQRPLWASTGVKDPALSDVAYVRDLVAPQTVNTMPQKTLDAFADHGILPERSIRETYPEAKTILKRIEALGISYEEVTNHLETEGVEKFIVSWNELLTHVSNTLKGNS